MRAQLLMLVILPVLLLVDVFPALGAIVLTLSDPFLLASSGLAFVAITLSSRLQPFLKTSLSVNQRLLTAWCSSHNQEGTAKSLSKRHGFYKALDNA